MKNEMIVKCKKDDSFEQDRKILHSCNRNFVLEGKNVFYIETVGYFSELIGQYYTICPYCGYMILLDENELSEEVKMYARKSKDEDPFLYKKNELISQLINLEYKTPKVRVRVRW